MSGTTRPLREPLRDVAFIARCAGAAALALVLAELFGLGHPVWATVSALIVSQDRLGDTHRSLLWRLVATLLGLAVAVATTLALSPLGASQAIVVATAVTISATATRLWPNVRVSMWTSAIVVLTTVPNQSVLSTALERGSEVLLGGAVGAVLHFFAEQIVMRRT